MVVAKLTRETVEETWAVMAVVVVRTSHRWLYDDVNGGKLHGGASLRLQLHGGELHDCVGCACLTAEVMWADGGSRWRRGVVWQPRDSMLRKDDDGVGSTRWV
ncbi:hypothetical protein L1987_39892 [Smallanthus sonchifolius]|uniref:Uncharacterized protein n=1 Tax=Smallanthus sonchifolius TaxID=185202 RepID=A0ACB9GSC0_9ASTR|nr:hypothetical protein L1987_39892 [Smallanthus sonchifolius]